MTTLAADDPAAIATAEFLLERGAEVNWICHDDKTPYDVARESGNEKLLAWPRTRGAKPAKAL